MDRKEGYVNIDALVGNIIADKMRTIRMLFVTIMVLIAGLIGTNAYWIWQNSQWEYVTTTEIGETKDNGTAIISSGEGDVSIGEGRKNNETKDKSEQ